MNSHQDIWMITGGAGYVGSHITDLFLANNKQVIVYDSLATGLMSRLKHLEKKHNCRITLIEADIRNYKKFEETIDSYDITGVIHTAALKAVGESFENEQEYLDVNFHATSEILNLIAKREIRKFIFSSTAAVYGNPDNPHPCKESDVTYPISPYGQSKRFAEERVSAFLDNSQNFGASLRFFNVVGTASKYLIDNSVENLVPIVLKALENGKPPIIFGSDYPTSDGTCIRDYVDVRDIAKAHLAIVNSSNKIPKIMNIGTGLGVSVNQIIQLILALGSKSEVTPVIGPRRIGDPAILYADVKLADLALGFTSSTSIEDSIRSILVN